MGGLSAAVKEQHMKKFFAALLALTMSLSPLSVSALELADAVQILKRFYVDEIPDNVLSLDSIDAILDALGDPYTTYYTAEEYAEFLDSVHGESLVGIGVALHNTYDQGGFPVMSVLPDSPALAAGLEPGDRITAVNGVPLSPTSNVVSLISGEEGTTVTVTVLRQDGITRDYTMTRRAVSVPIVTYRQEGTAGIIDCTRFGDSTIDVVEEALRELNGDVSIWIMDLRSNPGGTTQAAAGSAGLFLGGATMCYFRNADDEYQYIYTTEDCPDLTDKPLIILTSPTSASGSELFAAALRDHQGAIAIGQRTYGKGVAQVVFDETNTEGMFDGDAMKVTTQRFYSPNGTSNHIVGVLPTLLISPENTPVVALLLDTPEPKLGRTKGYMELDFNIFSLYVNLEEALAEANRAAFTELLEALPPFCTIRMGDGNGWTGSSRRTAQSTALELGLPFQSRAGFTDVDLESADWLETLAIYDLVAGYEDSTFRPENSITRAEFCTLLANAMNLPGDGTSLPFSDTPADAWYAGYVSAMASMGFIAGYEDGTFRPNNTITNQEIMAILSSAASWLSMTVYDLPDELLDVEKDSYPSFDPWAQVAARNLAKLNIILSEAQGQPQDAATRRTAAWLLFRVLEETDMIWGVNFPRDWVGPTTMDQ